MEPNTPPHPSNSQDRIRQLKRQIADLEKEVQHLEQQSAVPHSSLPPVPPVRPVPPSTIYSRNIPPQHMGMPPVPPTIPTPPKKKNWEMHFGKNILGILASALIFIGMILLAYATSSRILQFGSFIFTGILLIVAGFIGEMRKHHLKAAFLSVTGCGVGILYLGILLAYQYYHIFSLWLMYLCFLLWSLLTFWLSQKKKTMLFHGIGAIGMVVTIGTQVGPSVPPLPVYLYFLFSFIFYHFTNIRTSSSFRFLPFYCNVYSAFLLMRQIVSLVERAALPTDKWFFFLGFLGVATVLVLFQYLHEMRLWLRAQKASDRIWGLCFFPTLVAFFYGIWSFHHFVDHSDIILSVIYTLGAWVLLGTWMISQKNRLATPLYRITYLTVSFAAILLLQSAPYGLPGWVLAMAFLFGCSIYRKDTFSMHFAYLLFVFGTARPLRISLFSGTASVDFLLFYFIIVSLCNAALLCLSLRSTVLAKMRTAAIILQVISLLFPYWFLLFPLQGVKKGILCLVVIVLYFITIDQYHKRNTDAYALLFCGKYLALTVWLLALFRAQSAYWVLACCLLVLAYAFWGIMHQNRTFVHFSTILLLFVSGWTLFMYIFTPQNFAIHAFACMTAYGVLSALLHRVSTKHDILRFSGYCRFLHLVAVLFLLIGTHQLYALDNMPTAVQLLFAPGTGALLYGVSAWGMRQTTYRQVFCHLCGGALVQLFFSIYLFYFCFSATHPFLITLFFLLWAVLGCYTFISKQSVSLFFLTGCGSLFSFIWQYVYTFRMKQRIYATAIMPASPLQTSFIIVLGFLLAYLLLLGAVHRQLSTNKRIFLYSLQGIGFFVILHSIQAQTTLVSQYSLPLSSAFWVFLEIGVLLTAIILVYLIFTRSAKTSGSSFFQSVPYCFAICQIFLLFRISLENARFENAFFPEFDDLSAILFSFVIIAFGVFWYFAQWGKKITPAYWGSGALSLGLILFHLIPLAYIQFGISIALWGILLASMLVAAKCRQSKRYIQTAYISFLLVTFFLLLPLPAFHAFSLRQICFWLYSSFALCNLLVFFFEKYLLRRPLLRSICQGYNIFAMVAGSLLLFLRWSETDPDSFMYLTFYQKNLLTLTLILVWIFGTGRFWAVLRTSAVSAGVTSHIEQMPKPWQVGTKYALLVTILFLCYRMPNFVLSAFYFILASGFILFGFRKHAQNARVFGIVLLLFSICKMILFDISYAHLILRAVSFMICGVICFAIAFIYNSMEQRIVPKKETTDNLYTMQK